MSYVLGFALTLALIVIYFFYREITYLRSINNRLNQKCADYEDQLHTNLIKLKKLQEGFDAIKKDIEHQPEYPNFAKNFIKPGWDKRLKDAIEEGKE